MTEPISGFDPDDELEALLQDPVDDLDEDVLQDLQLYKSRKLQARRDSGESNERPGWWKTDRAPRTLLELHRDPEAVETSGSPDSATQPTDSDSDPDESPESGDKNTEPAEETETSKDGENEGENPEDDDSEPELSIDELDENPTEDELIRAGIIDGPVEQEDSQGVFQTSLSNRKAYVAYTLKGPFLTLNFLQLPSTITDERIETWVKDLLIATAFEHARDEDLKVIPQSPEISKRFLPRHPEYNDLVKESSDVRNRRRRVGAKTTSRS